MCQLEQQAREQQKLKVGDLVTYDPLVSYLIDNDEIMGATGIVLGLNASGLDIQVLVGSKRFWCYLGDLRLLKSNI